MPVSARTTIKGSTDPYLQTLHYRIGLKRHLVRKHADIKTLACCLETTVLPGLRLKSSDRVISVTQFCADFERSFCICKERALHVVFTLSGQHAVCFKSSYSFSEKKKKKKSNTEGFLFFFFAFPYIQTSLHLTGM